MPTTSPASRIRAAGDFATLAVFGSLLLLPLLHGDDDPTGVVNAARDLAPRPELPATWRQARDWARRYEQWFDDHFGFRSQLLALHTALSIDGFGVSPTEQVLVGDGEWLYYTRSEVLEDRRGELRLAEAELERWRTVLEARHAWLTRRGIAYAFAVGPNKVSVHPEHLPARHRGRPERPTRLDQIVAHLAARSTFRVVDGRGPLRAAAATEQVYHATDSHWNDAGLYVFHLGLLDAWRAQGCEREPYARDRFADQRGPFEGDLVRLVPGLVRSENARVLLPRFALTARPIAVPDAVLQLPHEWPADEPPVVSDSDAPDGVLLAFGDSFLAPMRPLLAEYFKRAYFVKMYVSDFATIQRFVDAVQPTAVLELRVERSLGNLPAPHVEPADKR